MYPLTAVHQVYNGSYDAPYVNPKAPVHFITGAPVSRLQWPGAAMAAMNTYGCGSAAEMNVKSISEMNISQLSFRSDNNSVYNSSN